MPTDLNLPLKTQERNILRYDKMLYIDGKFTISMV